MFKHDERNYLEYNIIGKFCIVSQDSSSTLDIWLTSPKDFNNCLSPRKLTAMLSMLPSLDWTLLDGEAHAKTTDLNYIRENAEILGIKRRKNVSDEQLEKLKSRFF